MLLHGTLPKNNLFTMLFDINPVPSNFEVREVPFYVERRPNMGGVCSHIGAKCCKQPARM
jgi:hypothetical protein